MTTIPLTAQYFENFARSFISKELIEQAGIFRVDSTKDAALVGQNGNSDYSGIAFPYFLPGEDKPENTASDAITQIMSAKPMAH